MFIVAEPPRTEGIPRDRWPARIFHSTEPFHLLSEISNRLSDVVGKTCL